MYNAEKFKSNGFTVVREKVEISPKEETYFNNPVMSIGKPYYEWHGKIEVDDIPHVKALVEGHGGHISRNSLSKNGKARFITLRDHESSKEYYERVAMIQRILNANDIPLIEEEYELCIYDTREELDRGWAN